MMPREFEQADAYLLHIIESGQLGLVELYDGQRWECGMALLEEDTEIMHRLGYLICLSAVSKTPPLATPETRALSLALINQDVLALVEAFDLHRQERTAAAAEDLAALDAQVRPLLAWLDQ